MRQNILRLIFMTALFVCGAKGVSSQERPKLREISDKKYEAALNSVAPYEKKGKCGYADSQGKFFIPAIFHKVRPMSDRHVGFVCFLDEAGREYWTPISLKGLYLTDLNFSHVVKDFDDRGLAVVRQDGKYGIISHTGKMVANCIYRHYDDKGLVYILYTEKGGCIAVAKDKSDKGYTIYSFAANEPIIVQTENGYGIVSPSNYFTVADFVYDSVKEIVSNKAYCLQKDSKKYLYVADKLSMGYEDVIPEQGRAYYVVKNNGKYGILTSKNEVLLSCSQDAIPVLKKNEYICLTENGSPVYLTVDKRVTASKYDDYLYNVKHRGAFAEYLLDSTLMPSSKKNILPSLQHLYGTMEFARVQHMPEAVEFADNLKLILLSKDDAPAQYLDVTTGWLKDAGDIIYHAFPSKTGAPAYASCIRNGKFGIIDIRNKNVILPFEYDEIIPLRNGYAVLHKSNSEYLYSVIDNQMITTVEAARVDLEFCDRGIAILKYPSGGGVFSMKENKWLLQVDGYFGYLDSLIVGSEKIDVVAVSNGEKYALYALASGDKLTDYKFDDFPSNLSLFDGKYLPVYVAGKLGVYDVGTNAYVLPCAYDGVYEGEIYAGNDYVCVEKDSKIGLYNLTKKKFLFEPKNGELEIKNGYVKLFKDEKYAVYSLRRNSMIDYIRLDDENGMIIRFPTRIPLELDPVFAGTIHFKYQYESYGEMYSEPYECNLEHSKIASSTESVGTVCFNVGDYYYLSEDDAQPGIFGNRKTDERSMFLGHDKPGREGYILKSGYHHLKYDYVIDNAVEDDFVQYDNELPKNNAALYNLHTMKCVIGCEVDSSQVYSSMEYIGKGLVKVKMLEPERTWIYDIVSSKWLLKTDKPVHVGARLTVNGEIGYKLHEDLRVFVPVKANFDLEDYDDLQFVNSIGGHRVIYDSNSRTWRLLTQRPNKSYFDCNRISLMYEPK